MKEIIIAFDIDGTLITNETGLGRESLRLNTFMLMTALSEMKNVRIIVWSGGGKEYAEQIVTKYGLTPFVSRCYSKQQYDETIDGKVDIAFDDLADFSLADKNIIVK